MRNCFSKRVLIFSVIALTLGSSIVAMFQTITINLQFDSTVLATRENLFYASQIVEAYPASNQSSTETGMKAKVSETFRAVADSERRGGEVSSLVSRLNSAVALLRRAQSTGDEALMREAVAQLDKIIQEASVVGAQGEARGRSGQIMTAFALTTEVGIAVLAYALTPRVFWRVWAKVRQKWRVRLVEG